MKKSYCIPYESQELAKCPAFYFYEPEWINTVQTKRNKELGPKEVNFIPESYTFCCIYNIYGRV